MKFFGYRQNNSGGTYMGPLYVIVQAQDDEHANSLATLFTDVHFDMSSSCECCGPRWHPEYGDGENLPSDVWVGPGYGEGRADAPLCVNALGDVVERSTLPMDVDSFDSDPFWVK
jgi:hypothetical protein